MTRPRVRWAAPTSSCTRARRNGSARAKPTVFAAIRTRSGDDVREEFILYPGHFILEAQLLFLEPLELQRVAVARLFQCIDCTIQITVLLFQPGEVLLELPPFLTFHQIPLVVREFAGTGN